MSELPRALGIDALGAGLALVLLIFLVVVWFLARLAKRSRAEGAGETDDATREAPAAGATIDLTTPPRRPDLGRSFARARRAIRRAFPGAHGSRSRPWILMLGPELAGKTTLLRKSRLGRPFGQPPQADGSRHTGVSWWALDDGVVVEVAGEDVLRLDGRSSDRAEWRAVLSRLRRSRPRRPIDGVVLTLPAHLFREPAKPLAQRLAEAARRGALLRAKLDEAERRLGMRLPVYLLISHCDLIPGFGPVLGSVDHRQQMLGWSNPASPSAPFSAAWLESAEDRLLGELEGFQLEALVAGKASKSPEAVLFPDRLAELFEPLTVYASHLFSPSVAGGSHFLRGIYLCGGGAPTTGDLLSEVAFVSDLFDRKVFPEAGLAQPTEDASARARLWRNALAGAAVVALAWTAALLWRGAADVRERADGVRSFVSTVQQQSPDLSGARTLVNTGSQVDDFRLRSALLPGSWLSRFPQRLNRSVESSFRRLAFEPFRGALVAQAEDLLERPPAPKLDYWLEGSVQAVEDYPEYQTLDGFTRDLEKLDRVIAAYQHAARKPAGLGGWLAALLPASNRRAAQSLEDFNQVSGALVVERLTPASTAAEGWYGRRLSGIRARPFVHDQNDLANRFEETVLGQADRLFDALFKDNPLLADLDQVIKNWIDCGAGCSAEGDEVERYRELQDSLDRTQRHLALSSLQWTAGDTLDLDDGFDQILRRVHESPFLGPDVAEKIMKRALDRFENLQSVLEAYASGVTGPFLLRADGKWQLSPAVVAVQKSLDSVLGEPFMQRRCTPPRIDTSSSGPDLYWSAKPLEEALSLFTTYAKWDDSAKLPSPLTSAPSAALDSVVANVTCLIEEARTFDDEPAGSDPELLEQAIKNQVDNLQAAEKTLVGLLDALTRLEQRAARNDLAQTLRDQRTHILAQLDTLLGALEPYRPQGGGFDWWQGESPAPGLEAFGAKQPDQLGDYLKAQRKTLENLASSYAQPLLGMFPSIGRPPASDWQQIVLDLGEYQNKTADNAVQRLEDFIQTISATKPEKDDKKDDGGDQGQGAKSSAVTPGVFDLYSCFSTLDEVTTGGSGFFLAQRDRLRSQLYSRCQQLADRIGYQKYSVLASTFDQQLWGRVPFAGADSAYDATPDQIRAFYQADFDRTLVLIENLPTVCDYFAEDQKRAVQEFMSKMAAARDFFAPFLDADAETTSPVYDLKVRFRIERTLEQGANQIISWLMNVGEKAKKGEANDKGDKVINLLTTGSVSPGPDDNEPPGAADGRWLYGNPVTLSFRWASGSELAPYAPSSAGTPSRWKVDGRTLTYRYREPWSLLRFLSENSAPPTDFPSASDPHPETVKLSIVTVSEGADEPREVAEIYLQVALLSPDKHEPLKLPAFQTLKAPTVSSPAPTASR